jgi:GNAT superfamily N-acetyltransferase
MKVKVVPVSDRRTKRLFVEAAVAVQPDDGEWVRPLNSIVLGHLDARRNPFYREGAGQAFVAVSDGQPVGRILAHAWPRQRMLARRAVGYFGLFESIDDVDVARALVGAARDFIARDGTDIVGPFNITAAQEMGIVVGGFEGRPSIDMAYNPPWYDRLLRECALRPCLTMQTWRNDDVSDVDVEGLMNASRQERLNSCGVTIRSLNGKRRREDMEAIRELVNSGFLGNWGFVPINSAEWEFQVGPLIPILDPALIQIAEVAGVAVGVTLAVPDYNLVVGQTGGRLLHPATLRLLRRKPLRDATVILFAVRKSHQGLGISRRLNQELIRKMQQRGYRGLSITWIAETNRASQTQAAALGAQPLHQLAMYCQSLSETS